MRCEILVVKNHRKEEESKFYVLRGDDGNYINDSFGNVVAIFESGEECAQQLASMLDLDDVRIGGVVMPYQTFIKELDLHGADFFIGECFAVTEQVYAKIAKSKGATIDEVKKRAGHITVAY